MSQNQQTPDQHIFRIAGIATDDANCRRSRTSSFFVLAV